MLRAKSSLVDWVKDQGLKADQGAREAETIARAVELAVHEFGVAYLTSKAGEVQARRLIALVLHAKIGNWDFAELVEELLDQVPGYLAGPGADQGTKHAFCIEHLKLTETEYLEALNKATNGGVVEAAWN